MRLSIDLEPTDSGWTIRYAATGADLALAPRMLTRSGDAKSGFPIPPEADAQRWKDLTPADAIETTLDDIINGIADRPAFRGFGNYLTASLLGTHLDALRKQPDPVELYLRIRATDDAAQRLPWELMFDGEHPLAGDPAQTIAVTRVIATDGPQPAATPLALPLRVLFVVGQTLDGAIRPGAEYMALLRRVAGTSENDVRITNIDSRLLMRATPAELAKAVDDFAPAVVHFICHGEWDGTEATLLLTKEENGRKAKGDHPVSASALLQLLRGASEKASLPTAVVLNACHTAAAGPDRRNAYRGFAAKLVAGGVPVAVGMAGEVADGACRIFTCELYQALLEGKSIVLASARGRRAALREYQGYQHTIEWARPSLFVASEQQSTLPVDRTRAGLADAAAKYQKLARTTARSLCGRFDPISAFESLRQRLLAGKGSDFALGFVVSESTERVKGHKPQYGKSRMLEELAARLALSAIAPVLISHEKNETPARNALELTVRIAEQMNQTRSRFGVAERKPTAAMTFAFEYFEHAESPQELVARQKVLKKLSDRGAEVDASVTRELLVREFTSLIDDLKPIGVTRAALLIDDLHAYEGAVAPLLAMLDDHGLGDAEHVIPLLFTYDGRDVAHGSLISETMKAKGHSVETLGPFSPKDPLHGGNTDLIEYVDEKELPGVFQEEILAHRQFLLTRHERPLAVSAMPQVRAMLTDFYRELCDQTGGIPSRWEIDEVGVTLKIYSTKSIQLLVDADDEEILKRHG